MPFLIDGHHWERGCDQLLSLTRASDHFRDSQYIAFITLTVDGSLGKDFSFEQPKRRSFSSDLKLCMLLGRHSRSSQKLRSNKVRADKHSINEGGTFLIAVPSKPSSDRLFIIPVNLGNELIL